MSQCLGRFHHDVGYIRGRGKSELVMQLCIKKIMLQNVFT